MQDHREVALDFREAGMEAYLVVGSSDRELSFGGMRVDPYLTRELVVELEQNMSLKLAGHGSPVGSAKAGIRASPDDPRLVEYLARFGEACRALLESSTILGKDMGAQQWMLTEIYRALGMRQLDAAHRRRPNGTYPERLCDLQGYIRHMTGIGVFWSIDQALGSRLRGVRVLVQGFGVVGAGVVWHVARAGARIAGISDCDKAVVGLEAMEPAALLAARSERGLLRVDRLAGRVEVLERDDLLEQEADVLVLAASSHLVDARLARSIRAPLVVEAANLALETEARRVLWQQGTEVIPDVVANSASAALVGHQIASGNSRSPEALWAEIERNIRANTEAVKRASRELELDPKEAFKQLVAAGAVGGAVGGTVGGAAGAGSCR